MGAHTPDIILSAFSYFERSTCCARPQQLQLKYLSLPISHSLSLSRAYQLTFAAGQFSVNFSLIACLSLSLTVSSCFSPFPFAKPTFAWLSFSIRVSKLTANGCEYRVAFNFIYTYTYIYKVEWVAIYKVYYHKINTSLITRKKETIRDARVA